ncbi:ABC transporter permease [Maribellus maritimus]|uniref:ABC transporter permease n=1 Tax=Maribellus maritimus TaxID=2870838 RepID=UPI001EEA34DA|nr:ABC transporter permease [Maribellus maritimus]MCG6189787.1 FtsX-like permease family protein [Maribellus maritimus]
MKRNSLRSFLKFLSKNKLYSFVTISGFAVSLMFVLLLTVYIKQELSVDQFHKNKDRLYRLYREEGSTFGAPTGEYIKNQLPEVEAYTRIKNMSGNAVFPGDEQTRMNYLLADSAFFTMFSFDLISGNPREVLKTKDKAVLSETFAHKIFGSENPVGQSFRLNDKSFIVSGVIKDMPQNTQFEKFDAIITFNMLAEFWNYPELLTTNNNSSFGVYFLAKAGTDLPSKAPVILEQFKKDYWMYKQGFSKELEFEPLTDVYFSNSRGTAIRQNNKSSVLLFGGIAILILVIAIINYINLTVAQAGNRSKEIAIKKLIGSSKGALVYQQISESVALSFFAALIAIALALIAEPFFNNQMDTDLNLTNQFNVAFVLSSLLIISATGLISGIIPALVTNKFNPVEVVKGSFTFKTRKSYSKILIAFQYTVAIVLLVSTLTITKQSNFMQNYDMGFNKDNIFWMDNTIEANKREAFRNELKSIPGVEEASFCMGMPIDGGNNQSFNYNDKPVSFQEFRGDSLYLKIFGLKVNETGVAYSKNGVWINQTAVNLLALDENPSSFKYYDKEIPVLGIVEDFNFRSLHEQIGPAIIRQMTNEDFPWSIAVKISDANIIETVKRIREKQASLTGGEPMEFGFVDSSVDEWYSTEVKRSKLIGAFTLLSIIISSMGIFAMSLYYIQQKVKEIGVRKVNGAKVSEVVTLLNKDFLIWVLIAFVIATPVAWFAMHKWLKNFAYKTDVSWWIFMMAGLMALGIALLTVSWQSWRAATRNPVEALRYE